MIMSQQKSINSKGNYTGYILVFVASFLTAWLLPVTEIFKGVASTPGAGALIALLAKLWRDERAHERVIELQIRQQDFVLGTASHMADVAYDKHVSFCEEYIQRVQDGLQELMRDGATKKAMNIGSDLVRVRIRHSAWLTVEIEESLKPFEMALINIGAKEHLLENLPVGERRTQVVNEVYRFFGLILGHEKPVNDEEASMTREKIIEQIRDILGINTLTALRQKAAELALERIEKR